MPQPSAAGNLADEKTRVGRGVPSKRFIFSRAEVMRDWIFSSLLRSSRILADTEPIIVDVRFERCEMQSSVACRASSSRRSCGMIECCNFAAGVGAMRLLAAELYSSPEMLSIELWACVVKAIPR